MSKYIGPVCRLCRREGEKLFLKGARCLTVKCAFERRSGSPPGQHGASSQYKRSRASDYSLQLREKQKARRVYGVLEAQFRRYYQTALHRRGLTGQHLLQILESRLDNVVYRLGFASSRAHARILVTHGHFNVNGRRTDVPSTTLKTGDVIEVRPGSRERSYFRELVAAGETRPAPSWLGRDLSGLTGRVLALPDRREIDANLNEQLIVEFYSR